MTELYYPTKKMAQVSPLLSKRLLDESKSAEFDLHLKIQNVSHLISLNINI